jgi:hypothetical protein
MHVKGFRSCKDKNIFPKKKVPSPGDASPLKIIGHGSSSNMHIYTIRIFLCTKFHKNPSKGLGVVKTKLKGTDIFYML